METLRNRLFTLNPETLLIHRRYFLTTLPPTNPLRLQLVKIAYDNYGNQSPMNKQSFWIEGEKPIP